MAKKDDHSEYLEYKREIMEMDEPSKDTIRDEQSAAREAAKEGD